LKTDDPKGSVGSNPTASSDVLIRTIIFRMGFQGGENHECDAGSQYD